MEIDVRFKRARLALRGEALAIITIKSGPLKNFQLPPIWINKDGMRLGREGGVKLLYQATPTALFEYVRPMYMKWRLAEALKGRP